MARENVPVKVGVLSLLGGVNGAQFVIPAYQRNYTWTAKKEVHQLLYDLLAVLTKERSKHFVGIMIYLEKSITPFHWERSVIDGQQRLTTIFLTLYAIKELMIEKGLALDAEKLENQYLINPYDEVSRFKLKPLVSDDEVYQHIVRRDFANIQNRNSNVYKNFIYIKDVLRDVSEKYSFNDILNAINDLYIVCVPIGEDDYPQKIFESINATGVKLTASDLIRNFLLMPIVSDKQDLYYEKYWKQIEELVDYDAKKLEAFFRFFIMAKKRSLVNKNAVYQQFTKWYDDFITSVDIEDIFIEIVNYAKCYNHLYKSSIDKLDKDLRKSIFEFRLNLSDMPAPLLMELYAIYMYGSCNEEQTLTSKQLSEIITILNSYLMRRSLCGMDTSDISNYFPELLRSLLNFCDGTYTDIVETFKRLLVDNNRSNAREMPDDKRLVERIKYANMYRLRQWVNIFFRKLESEDNPAPIDFSSLSIEHLMPQTPTKLWMASLECDEDAYTANVNRLGNLTFAAKSDNSRMSNNVWEYKNKVLASTNHLKMNIKLLECNRWKLENIENRTDELIKEIARLYPYYSANSEFKNFYSKKIDRLTIFIEDYGIKASAYYFPETDCVEIKAGTMLRNVISDGQIAKFVRSFRETLFKNSILDKEDDKYIFSQNYIIEKNGLEVSAAIILSEYIDDVEKVWHLVDGRSVKEWKESKNIEQNNFIENEYEANNIDIILNQRHETKTLLQTKKVDWSFLTSSITLSNECREKIQRNAEWRMKTNERRNIKIIINDEYFDSFLHLYNYDGRPNPVMQIRYPGRKSLIVNRIKEICSEKYYDIEQKRLSEENGIIYKESAIDRYVHIYMTDKPNVIRFVFK